VIFDPVSLQGLGLSLETDLLRRVFFENAAELLQLDSSDETVIK